MVIKKVPKIGIITPTFNQANYIRQTIDSVLNQKYPNLEYWIIDGKSTDDTVKILKSYGKKINWVSEKDDGQADAINIGFRKISSCDIYAYINSDDLYMPNTFELVAKEFQMGGVHWVTGD